MSSAAPETPQSFEASLAELERIVADMENGELPLEQSLQCYQRGVALLRQCRSTLEQAEQRIQMLEDGQLKDVSFGTDDA